MKPVRLAGSHKGGMSKPERRAASPHEFGKKPCLWEHFINTLSAHCSDGQPGVHIVPLIPEGGSRALGGRSLMHCPFKVLCGITRVVCLGVCMWGHSILVAKEKEEALLHDDSRFRFRNATVWV